MTADLHRDPDRLHRLARATSGLLDVLVPAPDLDPSDRHRLAAVPGGADLLATIDELHLSATRAGREIGELAARLTAAASSAETADADAAAEFRRIAGQL